MYGTLVFVVSILFGLVMGAALFNGCSTDKQPGSIAQKWLDAWARGDGEEVLILTVDWQADLIRVKDIKPDRIMATAEIGDTVFVSDISAYVVLTFPDNSTTALWLEKEDGNWKVDMIKTLENY